MAERALHDAQSALAAWEAEYEQAKAELLPELEAELAEAVVRIDATKSDLVQLERQRRKAQDARDLESHRVSALQAPSVALRNAVRLAERELAQKQSVVRERARMADELPVPSANV